MIETEITRGGQSISIAVEGIIGAGKTRFCRYLRNATSCLVIDEAESPLLTKYHDDRERWGFSAQMDLLAQRITALRSAHRLTKQDRSVILDRSIVGDFAFARANWRLGWLSAEEYRIYCDIYEELLIHVPAPDVTLYLEVDPRIAIKRAEKRDGVAPPLMYMHELLRTHDEVINDARSRGVIVHRYKWDDIKQERYNTEADFLITRLLRDVSSDWLGD